MAVGIASHRIASLLRLAYDYDASRGNIGHRQTRWHSVHHSLSHLTSFHRRCLLLQLLKLMLCLLAMACVFTCFRPLFPCPSLSLTLSMPCSALTHSLTGRRRRRRRCCAAAAAAAAFGSLAASFTQVITSPSQSLSVKAEAMCWCNAVAPCVCEQKREEQEE